MRATLVVLALLAACTGGERDPGGGAWEFRVDTTRSSASLRAVGKEGPPGAPQADAVILSFDCLPGHAGGTIMTEQALRQGSVEATLRLDAEPPRRLAGFAGTTPTGGQLVLTSPLDSVLALFTGHDRATVEYADGAGSSRTLAVFPVAGLAKYREPFLAACANRRGESE